MPSAVPRILAFAATVVSLASVACAGGENDEPSVDRVVNIEQRCEVLREGIYRDAPADFCKEAFTGSQTAGEAAIFRGHLLLTIRTSLATTYTIKVPPATQIQMNDPWPPVTK